MHFRQTFFLKFLYIAVANSLPNVLDQWDSQILSSDSTTFAEPGFPDMNLLEPQENAILDSNLDGSLLFNSDPLLASSGYNGDTSSIFQDLAGDESISIPSVDSGNAMPSSTELAMDDVCPFGYWNHCCYNGFCVWGVW